MAAKASVGDRRKRKDGHYWEKVGEGKWKRLAKKEDGDEPRESETAKVIREAREEVARQAKEPKRETLEDRRKREIRERAEEASEKDGPGERTPDELNAGDVIVHGGREREVVGVEHDPHEGTLVHVRGPGPGTRDVLEMSNDERVERVEQKVTNEQLAGKEQARQDFGRKVMRAADKAREDLEWDAKDERKARLGERREKRTAKGKLKYTGDIEGSIRQRRLHGHILGELEAGHRQISPTGDFGPNEVALHLRDLQDSGYVTSSKKPGPYGSTREYSLTELGRDMVAGEEIQREMGRGRHSRRKPMSEEEKKRKRREWAERYRRKKGAKPREEKAPTSEEELGAMISEAQGALDRRRAKRAKGKK